MLKFTGQLPEGTLFGFGLTEANLNRLQFNLEPIFFSFDYAGHPKLFALILYLNSLETPEAAQDHLDEINDRCIPFFDDRVGITPKTIRVFPIARSILEQFRQTPFWGYETNIEIWHPKDKQLFFAGRDEQHIKEHLAAANLIGPTTKQTTSYKGFGKH